MKRKWWIVSIMVLLEILVCGGILLTLWVGRSAFEGMRFFYITDTNVKDTLQETFVVDGPAVLDLEADLGDVTVTGSDGDEVEVVANLNLWGANEEDARRQVDVQMTQTGNRITVRVVRPETIYIGIVNITGSRADFEIRVPFETSLQLETDSGDLAVGDVTGAMELETSFGNIQIEDVSGAVSARSSSGDITLVGLSDGGDLEAETDFGKMILRNIIADSLTAHSDSGDIQAEEVELNGALDLETDFGDVVAVSVDATSYRLVSGSGSLTLDGCSSLLDLKTDFGDIEVRNATEAALTLKTSSGRVYFSGSLDAEGDHRVESEFGDVHVILPADAAFDLEAETDFGSIETDFAVTVSQFEEKHLTGQVNGGGPLLWMKTSSGDITLESITGGSD
ncbi:MAG: DUF4097 family beta strand repeat-containing protein [Chloroflexota bacterium]|nr:DUF4097 family beta strand repeat-containing protein [Chloroflexota bacterium]